MLKIMAIFWFSFPFFLITLVDSFDEMKNVLLCKIYPDWLLTKPISNLFAVFKNKL